MFALLFVTPSGGKHKGTQCTAYTPEQPAFSGSFRYLPCVSSQSTTFHWWSATTCFKDQTAIWFKCIQVRLWKDQLLILSLISFIGFNFLPSFKSRLVKPGGISGHFTSQDPQVLNTLTLWSHLRKAPCHHPAMKVLIFWRPWYINTHILNIIYTLRFQMLCLTSQLLKD